VFSAQARAMLCAYSWPGNVRELTNLVERFVVLNGNGEIQAGDLPEKFGRPATCPSSCALPDQAPALSDEGVDLTAAVSEFEKRLISQCLEKARGVKKEAARLLNVKRTTLVEKIKRYELERAV